MQLTAGSRVLSEKLTGPQLFKKFPAFYGSGKFIIVFTSTHHPSLFRTRSIEPIPIKPDFRRSILILSYHLHLGLQSSLFSSGLPANTKKMQLP
jgi:hypothetical protein